MVALFKHQSAVSYYFGIFFALLFFFAISIFPQSASPLASASASDNITGWALAIPGSDNTTDCPGITGDSCGYWISFNCTSAGGGACASSAYGVTVDMTSGLLSGYAWAGILDSTNCTVAEPCGYGWISFNTTELGGCPLAPCEARFSAGTLTGWAKVLSTNEWIRLNPPGGGVALNGSAFEGYAWSCNDSNGDGDCGTTGGADDLVGLGWIHFNPGIAGSGVFLNATLPSVTFDTDRTIINLGEEVTLTWTSSGATSCNASASPSITDWNGAKALNGTQPNVGPFNSSGVTTVTLTCLNSVGMSASVPRDISVLEPSFTLRSSNNIDVKFTGNSPKTTSTTLVSALPIGAFTGTINLSASMISALPPGITTTFNLTDPSDGSVDSNLTLSEYDGGSDDGAVFSVSFSGYVDPGTYTVRVTGTSGASSQFIDIPINASNFDPTIIEF